MVDGAFGGRGGQWLTLGQSDASADVLAPVDRRGAPRFVSLIRAAKLICPHGEFVCVIREVSSTGLSVRIFHPLPDNQTALGIALQNGEEFELELVRKTDTDAAFAFNSPVDVSRLIQEQWQHPRRALRLQLSFPVEIATLTKSAAATVINLSQHGARVAVDTSFALDQLVTVSAPHLPSLKARVRWRGDGEVGLAFTTTFALPDFARLTAAMQCPSLVRGL